jgi:hypothetical protein
LPSNFIQIYQSAEIAKHTKALYIITPRIIITQRMRKGRYKVTS